MVADIGSLTEALGANGAAAPASLAGGLRDRIGAYWRAANYLSVGQIYLYDNPLLRRPLELSHVKPLVVGHWGTTPGQNFIYVHLNRVIGERDLNMFYVAGPGHGGPALVANTYLEGTYSEVYPNISRDEAGLQKLFKQFSFPGGISSHVAPTTPGSIHEGGELGYSLSHAFGAVFDNPDLIVACVIGDGEAETGPLAAAWHSNKFLNPTTDGVVLPILHLNGYKISNPTVLDRIGRDELDQFLRGCGWTPHFVEGDDPATMHELMASTLDRVLDDIAEIRNAAADQREPARPRWPVIVLRSPKGWTGPKVVDGLAIEGTFRSHQVPLLVDADHPDHLAQLETWMRSYRPEELFDADGRLVPELADLAPTGDRRMGANPHTNGGLRSCLLPRGFRGWPCRPVQPFGDHDFVSNTSLAILRSHSVSVGLHETGPAKVRYRPKDDFHQGLQAEVGSLLVGSAGAARRRLAVKALVTSTWFYGSYAGLVLVHLRPWQAVALVVSLGLSGAAVAMGTAHDAVHGTISRNRRSNAVVALLAAPFGISRTWWRAKHNQLHHSFTNVHEVDDDLHFGRLLRLTPFQERRRWHRYQHVYAWLLYPIVYLAMLVNGDLAFITRGVIGKTQVARPTPLRALWLLAEKLTGLVLLLGLAVAAHPVLHVVAAYLAASALAGLVMAVVFQTGHCLDTTTFLMPDSAPGEVRRGWALTQVAGTADVAPSNRLYTTFTGGLNHHLEHHLFPQANQLLLPTIAPIVRRHCVANGVEVVELPTLRAAVRSHQRLLRRLGGVSTGTDQVRPDLPPGVPFRGE
ncbi:MAG: fatty acid desaturase [Actinomycetota bacterium]|nr:fatty acid desaturase [Actinomycetota bacterium]